MAERARILDLLAMWRKFAPYLSALLPYAKDLSQLPDWLDPTAARAWIGKLVAALTGLARTTANEIDDRLIAAAQRIVDNGDAWDLAYTLVVRLFTHDDAEEEPANAEEIKARCEQIAEVGAIDPALVALILQAVQQLVEWWRERRKSEPAPQPEPTPEPAPAPQVI